MIPQIGDFIAIAAVAAKAYRALDSTRGSEYEFTSLRSTLKALSQAMLQAEALCMEYHTSAFNDAYKDPHHFQLLNSVASDVAKERKECEALITQFMENFASYSRA